MESHSRNNRLQRFPDLIARLVPDAITASVILTLIMVAVAFALVFALNSVLIAVWGQ